MRFGHSVSTAGSTILIGAPDATLNGSDNLAGTVFIFDSNGNFLREITPPPIDAIPDPNGLALDRIGKAVAGLGTSQMVVGIPDSTESGSTLCGSAWVYDVATGTVDVELEDPSGGRLRILAPQWLPMATLSLRLVIPEIVRKVRCIFTTWTRRAMAM